MPSTRIISVNWTRRGVLAMPMSEETCRAIDILRSLRRASIFDPWTASELAVVVQYGDEAITERLAKHFRLDKSEEDHGKIHDTVRQIVSEIAERKGSVPALAGVRHTLGVLRRNHWVRSARGKGYWLTKSGEAVSLLDVMNACGYNAAITRCCPRGRDRCLLLRLNVRGTEDSTNSSPPNWRQPTAAINGCRY